MTAFTEADIRAGATSQSFERGSSYHHSGAVSDVVRRGNVLTAQVAGSEDAPYEIAVTLLDDGGIGSATCTCPYDWGGYCKHIVAVLLTALHEDAIAVKPELDTLLAGLTEAQLRRIIRAVAEDEPALVAAIEQEIEWLKTTPVAGTASTAPAAHSITFDVAAIRREMRKDFRQVASRGGGSGYSGSYWDDDEAGTIDPDEVLGPHREVAQRLLAAGDAAAATDVITAMIEEWGAGIADLDEWIAEANEDMFSETALELGVLLAEALLSQDFSPEQRDQWLARVEDWGEELINLDIVGTALDQWWDYPQLAAAMQGEITEQGAWAGEAPDFADELTLARLRILERQGRTQAYIHLAEAEGQIGLYVNMLARSGQVERAVAEARQFIQSPAETLSLAQVLVEQGERAAALAVAGHGLDLAGQESKTALARWTVTLAQGADDPALALVAAQTAFTSSYELADYQVVERLAGAESPLGRLSHWPAIKAGLLEQMEHSTSYHKVDIYLHEHMLAEAMAAVDGPFYSSDLDRVIQATRAEFPDWGIRKCQRQAESIMNAGKANAYDRAVAWVRTAHDIYLLHNRGAEWQAYLAGLLETHARKYKLVPMLRGIQ
ncbi:MAG: SWIM zinc finger family protein [Chloroflexi bacterium]|nr:SWIM zinc finger family protein [Chloroflexota bacterium]